MNHNYLLLLLCTLAACRPGPVDEGNGFAEPLTLPVPSRESGMPNFFVTGSGDVLLSWIEYLNDTTDALLFSRLEGEQWSSPLEVARGSNWFVNWADFPSLAAYPGGAGRLAAHWLQKSAGGAYDYDVRIAQSRDGGLSWSPPFIPHTDGIPAEHGFVTLLPMQADRILGVWLDGRNTKSETKEDTGHDHGHGGGAMTLRTAEFDIEGRLYAEAELDDRICDCCQTDAALSAAGPVIVYRDRSENEIRDISFVRKVNGAWTTPRSIHEDNWEIAGCPVNGPAIAADGQTVVVAWFTGAGGENRVNLAFSADAGENFGDPIRVDGGKPLGRVDVLLLADGAALVSWLENAGEQGEIRLARVQPGGKVEYTFTAAETSASRQSGFPILEKDGRGRIFLAWTQVDSVTTVKTAVFSPTR